MSVLKTMSQRSISWPRRGSARVDRRRTVPPLIGLAPIAVGLILWTLFGSEESITYPPPNTWVDSMKELTEDNLLLPAILSSFRTVGISLAIAIVCGIAMGCIIGTIDILDRALSPLMDFFRALPPPAVVAVIMLLFGLGYSSALLMVVLGAVWPVVLNTAAGVRALPKLRSDVGKILGLSRSDRFWKVMFPSLLPSILLGIRIAVSVAFVVVIFVEILNVTSGMGSLLTSRQQRFDGSGTWAILFLIGISGFLLNVAVAVVERYLLRGRPVGN
jgi:ABC-type nitrate/sulfonate/bicarbonate transport system permease component